MEGAEITAVPSENGTCTRNCTVVILCMERCVYILLMVIGREMRTINVTQCKSKKKKAQFIF